MSGELIPFKRKVQEQGGSKLITIPPELLEHIEYEEGDEIGLVGDKSKHGKFVGLFNITKQKKVIKE